MVNFIKDYVSRLSIDDIDTFAQKNNICLDNEEIEFIYNFIKKNYEALLINPDIDLPTSISESQIRYMIGEGIPPLLVSKIVKGVAYGKN